MNLGTTAHFKLTFDSLAVKNPGQKLLSIADADYELLSGWFGGLELADQPIPVTVSGNPPSSRSAPKYGIAISPGVLPELSRLRYMFVYELAKRMLGEQDRGLLDEQGSGHGIAVARYLAAEVLTERGETPDPELQPGNAWMASDRADFVGAPGKGQVANGCRVLFLYYLQVQLGFEIEQILSAAAPTLSGVYRSLTGKDEDPFPAFKALLDERFPGTETIPGYADNPWPIG